MTQRGIKTIRNAYGEVIIDREFACLEVMAQGQFTSAGAGYNGLHLVPFTGLTRPMVFVQLLMGVQYFFGPIHPDGFYFSTDAPAGTILRWKLCAGRMDSNAGTGIGIRINRIGSNLVAFSSRRNYIRLWGPIEVHDGTNVYRAGDSWEYEGAESRILKHPTKPVPADTYWLARTTGLVPRTGSDNFNTLTIRRNSTTEYRFGLGDMLLKSNKEMLNMAVPGGIADWMPHLVAT